MSPDPADPGTTDPTGGEAAAAAVASATTGRRTKSMTVEDIETALATINDPTLTYVCVGGSYHVARETELGHVYVSLDPLPLRGLVIWLHGYYAHKMEEY